MYINIFNIYMYIHTSVWMYLRKNQKKRGHKSDGELTDIEGVPGKDCVVKII